MRYVQPSVPISVFSKIAQASVLKSSSVSYIDEKWPTNNFFTVAFFAIVAASLQVE